MLQNTHLPLLKLFSCEEDEICSYFLLCIVTFWHVPPIAGETLVFWNFVQWQELLGNAHLLITCVCPLRKNGIVMIMSVRQGASPGETDDGWQEMWGIVTENTWVNFPGYCLLALDVSQSSLYQQPTDYTVMLKNTAPDEKQTRRGIFLHNYSFSLYQYG